MTLQERLPAAAPLPAGVAPLADTLRGQLLVLPLSPSNSLTRLLAGDDFARLLRPGGPAVLALPAEPPQAIRHVLFPADFAPRSEAAFEHTLQICQTLAAELHLLHVYGDDRLLPGEVDTARRAATTSIRDLLALDQQQLGTLATRARERGIAARSAFAEGRAHDAINHYATASAIDLIVMATHGPRTSEDILLGTTTARTVHDARVAVLAFPA